MDKINTQQQVTATTAYHRSRFDYKKPEINTASSSYDKVNISGRGKLLNDLPELLLPNAKNIEMLSGEFKTRIEKLMKEAGIPTDLNFEVSKNGNVESDSKYKDKIEELIKNDDEASWLASTVNALSSHAVHFPERMQFSEEFANAKNEAAQKYVINKYSHLFNDAPLPVHDITLKYGNNSVNLLVDGEPFDFV